jgi:hypothetical protein
MSKLAFVTPQFALEWAGQWGARGPRERSEEDAHAYRRVDDSFRAGVVSQPS